MMYVITTIERKLCVKLKVNSLIDLPANISLLFIYDTLVTLANIYI